MGRSYSSWFIVYLTQQEGIGWHTIDHLIKYNLIEQDIWTEQLLLPYIKQIQKVKWLITLKQQFNNECIAKLEADERCYHYRSILWDESDYPAILRECVQPPWVIYVKGRLELLTAPAISIVGTRAPTPYGIAITKQIARELSQLGCTIVSGLAGGIDTIAHQHSLNELGSTIAILPCGIKYCYPNSNNKLYDEIVNNGLLISESVSVRTVHKGLFAQRNRLIAGLSYATIIVEGEMKSGSMITAKYVMDMDRELFSVPGTLFSKKSEGPNFLIYKGYARMLLNCNQMFDELPWLLQKINSYVENLKSEQMKIVSLSKKVILTNEENIVLQHIKNSPVTLDDLITMTGYTYEHLNVILLKLCLDNYIQLHHGSLYIAL